MEDDQTQENQPDTTSKSPPLPSVVKVKPIPNPQQQRTHSYDTQKTQAVEQKIFVVVPSEKPKEDDFMPLTADRIASVALLLNIVIFYFTYKLFKETKKATTTAENALKHQQQKDVDDKVERYTQAIDNKKIHDEEVLRGVRRDSENFSNQQRQIEIQQATAQTQIDAINKQQENFELQNRAYLQLSDVIFEPLNTSGAVEPKLLFDNLGNYPAKTISITIVVSGNDPTELNYEMLDSDQIGYNPIEFYITKGTPYKYGDIMLINIIGNAKGKSAVYIMGRIKYEDLISKKRSNYTFGLRLWISDVNKSLQFLKNENQQISN